MSDPLRNIEEAAEWLGIPVKTLKNRVTERSVPFTFIGRHARFAQYHLDAIVAAGEQAVIVPPTMPLRVVGARNDATGGRPPAGPPPQAPPRDPPPRRSPPPPPPPPPEKSRLRRVVG